MNTSSPAGAIKESRLSHALASRVGLALISSSLDAMQEKCFLFVCACVGACLCPCMNAFTGR